MGGPLNASHRQRSSLLILGVVSSARKLQLSAILPEAAKNARNAGFFAAIFPEVFGHAVFRQERHI
jgi:hypothetical protein